MITFLCVGKVRDQYVKEGMQEFQTRLTKYTNFQYKETDELTIPEGFVIALDEHGKEFTSQEFSTFLSKKTLENKNITFLVGGATGISKDILKQCHSTIALSQMTYPNQLVRLIFIEQLYRAFTIIKGEPYHKE